MTPDKPRATLKTLARYLDLSVSTVSRALKGGAEVKPETIARVKAAAAELGYRPNHSGIGLKTGKTHVIALVMPVIKPGEIVGDLGTLPLIEGLTAGLADTPYHLTIIPGRPDQEALEPVRYIAEHGLADGVILNITRSEDERVKYLHSMNLPLVTFGRTELSIQHPYYDTDNIDFGYRAARYLLERGRRKLVMLTPPQHFLYGWHRKVGFQRALLEAGLDFNEHRQLLIEAKATDYRAQTRQWRHSDWQPDGIICGTEIAAMGVLAGLHDSGRVVGTDCDLVTLETSPLPEYFRTPVSGFHQDLHKVGRQLVSLLLDHIDQRKPVRELQIIEKADFIER